MNVTLFRRIIVEVAENLNLTCRNQDFVPFLFNVTIKYVCLFVCLHHIFVELT
jgi:hypothetical protein